MKCRSTAEECCIVHTHVPGQQTIVRDDDVVSNQAIVTDMRACHQEVLIADFGGAPLRAAAMDGTVFTNHVVVSDLDLRFSVRRERKILRRGANNAALSEEISKADLEN